MMCDILVSIKRGNTYQIIQSGYKMQKKKKKKKGTISHTVRKPKKKEIKLLLSPTTRPVIGPQSQINEEKACSIPSVCNN